MDDNPSANIIVVLNNGDGMFRNVPKKLDQSWFDLQLGLIDDDKYLDLVVILEKDDLVHIYFGFGNGSFAQPEQIVINRNLALVGLALDDLNNDGRVDIVLADQREDQLITLINACH